MEQSLRNQVSGGLVTTDTGWKCSACGFTSPLNLEMAEVAHRIAFSGCLNHLLPRSQHVNESQGAASAASGCSRNERLEEDSANVSDDRYQFDVTDIIRQLRCVACFVRWRSVAVKTCRHLAYCDVCFQRANPNCGLCRGDVTGHFTVKFHSEHLLAGISIPCPSGETFDDLTRKCLEMGFDETDIQNAIRQVYLTQAPPYEEAMLELLLNPNSIPVNHIPTVEEIESMLKDQSLDIQVKNRLRKYLRRINRCLICRKNPPRIRLIPCSHLAVCLECYERNRVLNKCPDCAETIRNHVMIYVS